MRIIFKLNNTQVHIEASTSERLSTILRKEFGLLSIKSEITKGYFGSSTVLMDNTPVPACMVPIFNADSKEIITLEYFMQLPEYKIIATTFKQAGVHMCGYCNTAKIFTAYQIYKNHENFDTKKIKEMFSSQSCRCTVTENLIDAINKIKQIQGKYNYEK